MTTIQITLVPLWRLDANPYQPPTRLRFEDRYVVELADDIARNGLISIPAGRVVTAGGALVEEDDLAAALADDIAGALRGGCECGRSNVNGSADSVRQEPPASPRQGPAVNGAGATDRLESAKSLLRGRLAAAWEQVPPATIAPLLDWLYGDGSYEQRLPLLVENMVNDLVDWNEGNNPAEVANAWLARWGFAALDETAVPA